MCARHKPVGTGRFTEPFVPAALLAEYLTDPANVPLVWRVDAITSDSAGLEVVNLCPEPLEAAVISEALTGRGFVNPGPPRVIQDVRSNHAGLFGGRDGYLFGREAVLEDLRRFAAGAVAA